MGETERVWLTYEAAGKALGIKPASAKRLSFRRHWPHRAGNDGLARVGVPVTELRRVADDAAGDMHHAAPGGDSGTVTGDKPGDTAALALALDRIEALAGQVGQARGEVERLRAELVDEVRARAAAETAAEELRDAVRVAKGAAADATRRVGEMEAGAVEGWTLARDLAARLAVVGPPTVPVRPPPASPRRKGLVARLLGR